MLKEVIERNINNNYNVASLETGISELNKFFEEMEKGLHKEYSEKDFEEMENEYRLQEQKKERCNYGR